MFSFLSISVWNAIHLLIVHLPIGVLFLAPVFLVLAMLWARHGRLMLLAAAILVALGSGGAVVAVMSGEAGESSAKAVPAAHAVFERHEELAETARNMSLAAAGVLAILTAVAWRRFDKRSTALRLGVGLGVLGGYSLVMLSFASAAHEGGRLVHEFGVRALIQGAPAGAIAPSKVHPDDD